MGGTNNKVVRLSALLVGLPEFARAALSHSDSIDIDDATRAILDQTAAGNPPNIWM
jgi:hypothetical protein